MVTPVFGVHASVTGASEIVCFILVFGSLVQIPQKLSEIDELTKKYL